MRRETSKAQKRYWNVYGQPHRDRTPQDIHEALQRLFKRNGVISKLNSAWFKDTPECFMANYTPEEGEADTLKIVGYEMNHKEGAHSNWYADPDVKDRDWAKALRNEELPLLMNDLDDFDSEVKRILKERMKGERPEPELRQDLHERKVLIDNKWRRVREAISVYLGFLKKIIEKDKYSRPVRYDFIKMYVLEIGDTEYRFESDRTGVKYLSQSEVKRMKL